MSATHRFRIAMGLAGFLAVLSVTVSLDGKEIQPLGVPSTVPGKDKEDVHTDEFSLIIDEKRAPRVVESVIKHLKADLPADEWKDIITNLQILLDDPTDKLVEWVDPLSQNKKPRKDSVHIVANKLIGRFSKQGRDFYQREFGPTADQKLKDAVERGDILLLAEVAHRYFHTKAGAEATVLQARFQLDRGHYNTAAEIFRRYLERNPEDPIPVNVTFLAALSYKRLAIEAASRNDREEKELYQKHANEHWEKVKKEIGNKPVKFGNKEVTLAQLEAEFNRAIALQPTLNQKEWFRAFGNNANNAQGVGSGPFLDPTWQFSLTPILDEADRSTKGQTMAWIEQNLKQMMQMYDQTPNHPLLPEFFPVASSGKIVFRTYDGIYCVATRDDPNRPEPVKAGVMLWMLDCNSSLYAMVQSSASRSNMDQNWLAFYKQQGPKGIFFENGLIGSLSHDGTNVYLINDIAVPPHPQLQQQFGNNGQPMMFGSHYSGMVFNSELRAVNLETGKRVWDFGARIEHTKDSLPPVEDKNSPTYFLSHCYFLGAPLPLGGKLYVVVEYERELRLVCLDPAKFDPATKRPEMVWSQPLGSPSVPLPTDTLRRIQGIQLAYSDNILVVPTNAGAVLGIDLLSHSLIWARSYRQTNHPQVGADANQPQFNQFGRGGRFIQPNPNGNQNLNADRWRSSAPIISGGKVVLTSYDSNSIVCLNLRDGEILWETARSSEDLYVGGAIDNKVLVVGKSSVKFLDLNKGTQLGSVNTGMPSGVGTASNDVYYLPVKATRDAPEPKILSIDAKEMKLTAQARSRKKLPVGNLVFFDGAVFSQTATNLTSFPQLNVKIEEATKRLAANRNDPIGLAEMGDLMLDKGELSEAIDSYNKCLANKPNDDTKSKAREKLYDAITELLQRDFNLGEKRLDQYKELCNVEIPSGSDPLKVTQLREEELRRKSNYFCLVAKGKETQGKLVEAFDNYLAFGSLSGNKELVSVIDQPSTFAAPHVWVRGRINHMLDKATPEQRKPLLEKAATEWEAVKKAGDLDKLRNFVRVFGTRFDAGSEARLMLADKLMATNSEEDLRDAENVLLSLKELEEPVFAAQATEALARLYIRKGLFDDAMGLYGDLNRNYAKVPIRDGKNGSDLFNELITDKRFLPYLEPLRQTWIHSKLKAQEITGNFQGNPQQQQFTISPDGESIPFYNRYKIVMDMMTQGSGMWSFKVIDRVTGEQRYASSPMIAPEYLYRIYPPTNNHRFAQFRGHLMIVNLNNMVFAYDLVDKKELWKKNLFGTTMMPNPIPTAVNEPDGIRLVYQDGWTQKVGQVGVLEASYICLITRDGLMAVDPATGTALWTKSNVSSRVQLTGDENHVFIFESNAEGKVTSARAVRSSDGVEVQIKDSSQVFTNLKHSKTVGRHVLVLDEKGDKKSMRFYDILTGKDDWTKEIDGNAIMLRCEDPHLTGYVSDKGEVMIFNVKDGKEIFSAKLDAKKLAQHMKEVDGAVLLTDRERFFVVLNKPWENNNANNNPSLTPGIRTLKVNGHIYCFDRNTKKRLWYTDEQFENQQIILDQFEENPIVLGVHFHNKINNGVFEGNGLRVVAIDKRTGLALFRKEAQQGQPFHVLNVDPRNGTVELVRPDLRIKFAPDDGKPRK